MSNDSKNQKHNPEKTRNIDWSNRGKAENNSGNEIKKGIDFENKPPRPTEKPKKDDK